MANCNPCRTPIDTESKLGNDGDPVSDPTLYRSLAGSLQYLTFTRPDISYAVQQVCLHMHDPREPHFLALKRILRYVRGTLDYGFQFFHLLLHHWLPTQMRIGLVAQPLSDLLLVIVCFLAITCSPGPLSVNQRFIVPVQRQSIVVLPMLLLRRCCLFIFQSIQHQRMKHIEIDIHFVRDLVAAGQVRVLHVPSRYQYADIFIKGFPSALFGEFRTSLSIRCPPASTAGEC
ncbi:ribonuclease H-like domain-containing protein [Tanacetum coccineum]